MATSVNLELQSENEPCFFKPSYNRFARACKTYSDTTVRLTFKNTWQLNIYYQHNWDYSLIPLGNTNNPLLNTSEMRLQSLIYC